MSLRTRRTGRIRRLVFLLSLALAIFEPPACRAEQGYQESFIVRPGAFPSVHAATIAMLPDGAALCCWYAGSKEMASDVQIYCSRSRDGSLSAWSPPTVVVRRQDKATNAWFSNVTLGNPVLFLDDDGVLWLFYSATTLFEGWSAAHVEYRTSLDCGKRWSQARRLTEGFGNMVRTKPLLAPDGDILLPLYQELFGWHSSLWKLRTRDGKVIRRSVTSIPGRSIQPAVVRRDGSLTAYMRVRKGERVLRSVRTKGGQWTDAMPTNVPNPDSSLDAIDAVEGVLLVCNPSPQDRKPLSLMFSYDGSRFIRVADIEGTGVTASYPALIRDAGGVYHLVYTYDRRRAIKLVSFTEEWLKSRLCRAFQLQEPRAEWGASCDP